MQGDLAWVFGEGSNNEDVIWAEMVKDYQITMGVIVHASILPALEVLQQEHIIHESDFFTLAMRSPVIPPGRERIFAKALFCGFVGDFVAALHIIVPQLENLVRYHLKQYGAQTTTIDVDGIENENGLSTLMDMEATKEVFGEDLVFEIRAIFCDPFGPNLRNELAHGLLDYDDSESACAIYAWWMCLRIIFTAMRNAHQAQPSETKTSYGSPSAN